MPKKKSKIDELTEIVKSLTAQVQSIKQSNRVEITDQTPTEVKTPLEESPVQTSKQEFPIPQEYRETINQTLNKNFGIDVKAMSDSPAFMLTIIVPKKYSNMTKDEWDVKGADLRSRVINYAEGTNGVKLWAEQVFNNFAPEIKAQIVADRI